VRALTLRASHPYLSIAGERVAVMGGGCVESPRQRPLWAACRPSSSSATHSPPGRGAGRPETTPPTPSTPSPTRAPTSATASWISWHPTTSSVSGFGLISIVGVVGFFDINRNYHLYLVPYPGPNSTTVSRIPRGPTTSSVSVSIHFYM
jgi:hypothetical protein